MFIWGGDEENSAIITALIEQSLRFYWFLCVVHDQHAIFRLYFSVFILMYCCNKLHNPNLWICIRDVVLFKASWPGHEKSIALKGQSCMSWPEILSRGLKNLSTFFCCFTNYIQFGIIFSIEHYLLLGFIRLITALVWEVRTDAGLGCRSISTTYLCILNVKQGPEFVFKICIWFQKGPEFAL